MKITWIGQSGYIIKTDQTKIIIDPYLSEAVNRVAGRERMVKAPAKPEEVQADAVICTHNHLDHLDVDAIECMDKSLWYITTDDGAKVIRNLGCSRVTVMSEGDTIQIGDIGITGVAACHTVDAFGVVLKADGITLYFSGDTLYDPKLFAIADFKPDYTFICINGKLGNMNVDEAVEIAVRINAGTNIPNHYGMFESNTEDPVRFTDKISNGFIMEYNREYSVGKKKMS